ncbi:MAG: GTP 3',8-cyclase MoaA [Nitrospirota bacterium]|nr:GTP 3',8-cyclase MoaA [Nitrospirota bacterium]
MPLVDHHNRHIDYLRVSVTDRCNLSCVYCKPRGKVRLLDHQGILRYEEILRLVGRAASLGISHVRVTGGEPLVRRGILPFIGRLCGIPGISDVSLTTNGVLLSGMAEGLRAAGITRLNISLDSLRPERFAEITGSDAWAAVWRGIEKAETCGFHPIKINMVPVKGVNDDEIADFARLTVERDLHVRFIEFMPIGAHDRWHSDACVPADEVRAVIEREFGPLEAAASHGVGPSRNHRVPGGKGVIGFISPITKHFCSTCRRLRLTADGKIRPCLLSDTEIDVKSPLRAGCEDGELERLLKFALEIKPERHFIAESGDQCFTRTMSKIGG